MATAASHVVGASRSSVATTLLVRCFASLVGSGIPSPRHDVALKLSTPHGGHINNMILTSQSILELDSVLHKFRKRLRPAALGAASMQLEHLHRCVGSALGGPARPGSGGHAAVTPCDLSATDTSNFGCSVMRLRMCRAV